MRQCQSKHLLRRCWIPLNLSTLVYHHLRQTPPLLRIGFITSGHDADYFIKAWESVRGRNPMHLNTNRPLEPFVPYIKPPASCSFLQLWLLPVFQSVEWISFTAPGMVMSLYWYWSAVSLRTSFRELYKLDPIQLLLNRRLISLFINLLMVTCGPAQAP